MIDADYLNVWYGKQQVGRLWQNATGMIGFSYEDSWCANGFAISQQLPLSKRNCSPESGTAHKFFANLLPEANTRMRLLRDLKCPDSDYQLLKAIGGECAGALSILPNDLEPNQAAEYIQLTTDKLDKLILQKGNIYTSIPTENMPRLSLAGAQDKCPIFYDGKSYFLPQNFSPSTHILKFEITDYRHVPAYEYFLSQLAQSVSLPVVETELKKRKNHTYLLIKRYDRVPTSQQQIQRLHQEDFCQALGFGYQNKYQQYGGPSFKDCYQLLQQISTDPIIDTENLLRWQIFNVLTGNSDGHAKNLALLYHNQCTRLAPFYDMVCTRAIERIDTKLAFSIGNEYDPDKLTYKHWQMLADECNINQKYLVNTIKTMAAELQKNLSDVQKRLESSYGSYPALQRVTQVVSKLCKRTRTHLPA